MAWLLRDGEVLASLETAAGRLERVRGFSARRNGTGAVLLSPAKAAHSIGVGAIDVAYLDADLVVVATTSLAPHRVALPRRRARSVLEAEAGAFERWGLRPGDCLEISD